MMLQSTARYTEKDSSLNLEMSIVNSKHSMLISLKVQLLPQLIPSVRLPFKNYKMLNYLSNSRKRTW